MNEQERWQERFAPGQTDLSAYESDGEEDDE